MDGFDSTTGIVVLGATNRPDVLDAALLRPGRFDRRVHVAPPDKNGRREILKVHTRSLPLPDDVDLERLAATTPGMVGADGDSTQGGKPPPPGGIGHGAGGLGL